MSAIELTGVTKRFGDITAVDDLDLTVAEGEVYGLIGPNGSGKSTVLNLLLDFIRPTTGRVTVFGHDAQAESLAVRERLGVVPEGYAVYDRLTARQHLEFVYESKAAEGDVDALLERVGLREDADRAAGDYSSGMRKRLILAMALVGDPDLLIFDEPFRGLDPNASLTLRETIVAENDRGSTVLVASHLFEQLEVVCDRVGLLLDGTLVAENSVRAIRTGAGADTLRVLVDDPGRAADAVRDVGGVTEVTVDDDGIGVTCEGDTKTDVLVALVEAGLTVNDVGVREAPIEELFLAHAGDRG
jgi:ABC-2 type transport system ATP-binding protein